jgi:ribosome biogenesis protein BMS1
VKITISKIKYMNAKMFNGKTPLILTSINPGEDNMGFLKVRIKKHRWYPNILKNNDPLIFSIGWKRF